MKCRSRTTRRMGHLFWARRRPALGPRRFRRYCGWCVVLSVRDCCPFLTDHTSRWAHGRYDQRHQFFLHHHGGSSPPSFFPRWPHVGHGWRFPAFGHRKVRDPRRLFTGLFRQATQPEFRIARRSFQERVMRGQCCFTESGSNHLMSRFRSHLRESKRPS